MDSPVSTQRESKPVPYPLTPRPRQGTRTIRWQQVHTPADLKVSDPLGTTERHLSPPAKRLPSRIRRLATAAKRDHFENRCSRSPKNQKAASEQFVCHHPSHMKTKSVSDLLSPRQTLRCYCSIVAASNQTRRAGRLCPWHNPWAWAQVAPVGVGGNLRWPTPGIPWRVLSWRQPWPRFVKKGFPWLLQMMKSAQLINPDMCALVKARRQSRIWRERHPMSKTVTAKDAEMALGLADVVAKGKEQMCTCEGWHSEGWFHKRRSFWEESLS